jgi:alpha-amylase
MNTLTRREEGYHEKILSVKSQNPEKSDSEVVSIHDLVLSKEEGLEKYLTYDWYRRGSLIDHFLGESTEIESFSRCQYPEQGDFVTQPYQHKVEKKAKTRKISLERDGWVWVNDKRIPLALAKTIQLEAKSSLMEITYSVKNNFSHAVDLWFGVEFNFSLTPAEDKNISYLINGKAVEAQALLDKFEDQDVTAFEMKDRIMGVGINLQIDKPAILWRFPILTVSLSESGFEKNYQSSVVFPSWKIKLQPDEIWDTKIIQRIVLLK